jgi:hypothetical protein
LTAGSIYFNTTDSVVKVYTGSAWVVAYADGATLVAKAGDTMTGDLSFGDNDKAIFGAGSDLEIYHDGSQSRISDTGTGRLTIETNGDSIRFTKGTSENMLIATPDGAVTLYHDNSAKLATTSTGIDVTGSIGVSGTVDGRDVATDGTKLDGIEASADVTDTTNVTAAGAAMLTGATFTGGITATGIDVTGNATFGDNGKAIFGAGSDLQIYHNGTDSFIDENGSGWLYIRANDMVLGKYTGETYVKGIADGAVELYHDNAKKIETTSTGIDVNGSVRALRSDDNTQYGDFGQDSSGGFVTTHRPHASLYENFRFLASNNAGTVEHMRIDSSGNVLVGMTSSSGTANGLRVIPDDFLGFTTNATDADDRLVLLNRQASEGNHIEFRQANSTVGSIGVKDTDLYIGKFAVGLSFDSTGPDGIRPFDINTQSYRDNAINLGGASARFNDLYLGGTAYVGTSVGIGTTSSPAAQFEINSSGFGHRIEGVSANNLSIHRFITDTNDTDKFVIGYGASHPTVPHQIALKANNAAGTVGLYTNGSEGARLLSNRDFHVDGNVIAYSTTISDIRLKKDIAPIEDAVTKVQQLNGCTFTYLKDDRKSAGLIAQDLEKVLPSCVIEDEAVFHGEEGETYKTVQYDQVIGLLVEAVKELKQQIEDLKKG